MKVLVIYVHPGQQHSKTNAAMVKVAQAVKGVTFVDLYARYPRHDIDIDREQKQLLEHDAIVFQFPLMWYSTPSLMKEWQDLVLEYGFAYGEEGDRLTGKLWVNAVTAGSPDTAYGPSGHNKHSLPEFLAPLEATARLCNMPYLGTYMLFSALKNAGTEAMDAHVAGYKSMLQALCDDQFDLNTDQEIAILFAKDIASLSKGATA